MAGEAAIAVSNTSVKPAWRSALEELYAAEAARIQHAEAFEITEYGRQPTEQEIRKLFPFFPGK